MYERTPGELARTVRQAWGGLSGAERTRECRQRGGAVPQRPRNPPCVGHVRPLFPSGSGVRGMFSVALVATVASTTVWAAGRRLARHGRWPLASVPVCGSAVPVTAVLLVSALVPTTSIAVAPIVGILIGAAVAATTLTRTPSTLVEAAVMFT